MNLMIQILLGFFGQHIAIVTTVLLALVILYGLVITLKLNIDKKAIKSSILVGAAAWIYFMLSIPSLTMSSLSQLTYITDWLFLFIMASGYTALVTVLTYPVCRLFRHIKK